jgi:hypothetical protein
VLLIKVVDVKLDKVTVSLFLLTFYALITLGVGLSVDILSLLGSSEGAVFKMLSMLLVLSIVLMFNRKLLVYQLRIKVIAILFFIFVLGNNFSFFYPLEIVDKIPDVLSSIVYFMMAFFVVSKVNNFKQIQQGVLAPLIVFGLIEWLLKVYVGGNVCVEGHVYSYSGNGFLCEWGIYPPTYLGFSLVIMFYNKKVLFNVLSLFFITVFYLDINRTGFVALVFMYATSLKIFEFLLTKKSKLIFLYVIIAATLLVSLLEFRNESMNMSGRGDIWGYWIYNFINDPLSVFFGYGPIDGMHVNQVVTTVGSAHEQEWATKFHSGIISIVVMGGVFQLVVCMLIIHFSMNNDKDSIKSAFYYYSILIISLNSYREFFGPQLEYLIFSVSLFSVRILPLFDSRIKEQYVAKSHVRC